MVNILLILIESGKSTKDKIKRIVKIVDFELRKLLSMLYLYFFDLLATSTKF